MTIIVDTREQKNAHLLKVFKKNNIEIIERKLDVGDYSFEIEGQSYEKELVIERKANLNELASNFTSGRDRFNREFERSINNNTKVILLVEKATMDDIKRHNYRSKFHPNAFIASLQSWSQKFGLIVVFGPRNKSGDFIINSFNKYLEVKANGSTIGNSGLCG